jgi:microcystin-dependent protein
LSSSVNQNFTDIATGLSDVLTRDGQAGMTAQFKAASGTSSAPGISFTGDATSGLYLAGSHQVGMAINATAAFEFQAPGASTGSGFTGLAGAILNPIGQVIDFAGSSAPTGWLLCYGQAISRTTYAELFAVISTTYGVGNGTTTFNIPDCRGVIAAGKDDMGGSAANKITTAGCGLDGTSLGAVGGNQSLASHTHTITDPTHSHSLYGSPGPGSAADLKDATSQAVMGDASATSLGYIANAPANSTAYVQASATGITATNSTGSGSSANVQPTIMFNKIIFVGHG